MENHQITVEVRMRYEWQETSASRLRKPIEDHLIPALPTAEFASGTVIQHATGDFEKQFEFKDVRDWLNALAEAAVSYRLWLSQGMNTLDLTVSGWGVEVAIRGEPSRADEFRGHIEQFASAAGLKAKKPPATAVTPVRASSFSKSGDYRLVDDVTADSFLKVLEFLLAWVGDSASFNGTIETKTDRGSSQRISTVDVFKDVVPKQWSELSLAAISAYGSGRSANLRVEFASRTANLNLTAEDNNTIRAALSAFESTLKVAPRVVASSEATLKGEQRRYYTAGPITIDWVRDKMLALLSRIFAKGTGFNGTFRVDEQSYTLQDFDAWKKEVELRWQGMQAAGCRISAPDFTQFLDVDFVREQVTVDLRKPATGAALVAFLDYESELNLVPAPARPYQYYRFARRYQKINDWDIGTDKIMAEAIEKSISAAFGQSGRYVFINASTTEGSSAEIQTPFASKDAFLERLRTGVPYVNARIYLQGPRGYDLGIQLQRTEKKLLLRSSIPDAELFKKVAEPFNKIYDLKEYESENRNAAGEVQKKPSRLETWTPFITSGSSYLAVGVSVLSLMIASLPAQKTSLEILAPRDNAEIPGKSCPVEWTVTRKALFHADTSETPEARVRVMKEGGDPHDLFDQNVSWGTIIAFPSDGAYDVTVSIQGVGQKNVRVTVKTPATTKASPTKK